MYQENDFVMYKNDVCRVSKIKHNAINNKDYYILLPIDDPTLIIDVPTDNRTGYLRNILTKEEAEKLIKKIKDIEPLKNIQDKNIESTYKDLISHNNHEDLVKIIKTSYLRNEARTNGKRKPSEKDSKYFEKAEKYLYNELAIALGKSFQETKDYILKSFEGV